MSKPREVIARALYAHCMPESYAVFPELFCNWLGEADAAIDALEGREVTDKMSRACWENMDGTSGNIWRAMVGAMRDE